jgi:hypothetical protein
MVLLHMTIERHSHQAMLLQVFSFIGATGGFEGVAKLSTMTKFSHASTKSKKVVGIMWYLHLEGVEVFYLTN